MGTNPGRATALMLVFLAAVEVASAQGWKSQDVGNTIAGTTDISGGTITIEGNGNDIWGDADAFRFVYLVGDGDCEIMARVTQQEQTNNWAKAGVMVRQSLQAGSVHAFMCRTPANGMAFQWRPAPDGASQNNNGGPNGLPRWVWLQRSGNTFTGRYAADIGGRPGSWSQQGNATAVSMTDPVHVGLAVTSHESGILSTAVFDNIVSTGTRKAGAGLIIGRSPRPEPPRPRATALARFHASLFPHNRWLERAPSRPVALADNRRARWD